MSLLLSTTNASRFLICPSLLSDADEDYGETRLMATSVVNAPSRPSCASSESLASPSLSLSCSTQHLNPSFHFWLSHHCRHQRTTLLYCQTLVNRRTSIDDHSSSALAPSALLHYWLRDPKRAPNSFLKTQIENTFDVVSKFANDVINGKIKLPSSPEGRFTQTLSVEIRGSAFGPQFVTEALAPDNPPLKTRNGLLEVQKAFREAGLDFLKQKWVPDLDVITQTLEEKYPIPPLVISSEKVIVYAFYL
ncbi:hypothetical protein V8G54_019068 [Vigna mungo]|uniref:Uncharacterized protein n=1 Tax=Vigna mungo TaxID=3915 RepID=A0AAQ3NAR6_VIGMU